MDLLNQKFNFLKVIEKTPQRDQRGVLFGNVSVIVEMKHFVQQLIYVQGIKKVAVVYREKLPVNQVKKI